MLYRGMDRAALDAAYNNTAAVGQSARDRHVFGWTARSNALRASRGGRLDLRYGDGPRQRVDVFACGRPATPTLVYIHGGYWQMNDKEPYAFLGEALLPAGFNLALVEYTLAPAARMDAIVAEVRASVARVFVSGHSAGGHLTAMTMTDTRVAGGLAISGLYDLEPIRLNYLNDKLRLDEAEAKRNSPMLHLPSRSAPLIVTVGLGELPELIRQSQEYAEAWQKKGLPGQYLPVEKHDHFSILEELARPDGKLFAALKELAGV